MLDTNKTLEQASNLDQVGKSEEQKFRGQRSGAT